MAKQNMDDVSTEKKCRCGTLQLLLIAFSIHACWSKLIQPEEEAQQV